MTQHDQKYVKNYTVSYCNNELIFQKSFLDAEQNLNYNIVIFRLWLLWQLQI